MPVAPISIAATGERTRARLRPLRLEAPVIVGRASAPSSPPSSRSAICAARCALALIDPLWPRFGELQAQAAKLTLGAGRPARGASAREALRPRRGNPPSVADRTDLRAQLGAGLRAPGAQAALAALLEHRPERLHEIAVPTLIVRGANDRSRRPRQRALRRADRGRAARDVRRLRTPANGRAPAPPQRAPGEALGSVLARRG